MPGQVNTKSPDDETPKPAIHPGTAAEARKGIQLHQSIDSKNKGKTSDQHNNQIVNLYYGEAGVALEFDYLEAGDHTVSQEIKIDEATINHFRQSRILVINSDNNQLSNATVASVVFGNVVKGIKPACCTIESHHTHTLRQVVSDFRKSEQYAEAQVIVIYELRPGSTSSTTFLHTVTHRGGHASAFTNKLKEYNLFVIYVCNDLTLYNPGIVNHAHFTAYNINNILLLLQRYNGYHTALQLHYRILKTVKETGWLSDLSEDARLDELTQIMAAGTLDSTLDTASNSIDRIKENKIS